MVCNDIACVAGIIRESDAGEAPRKIKIDRSFKVGCSSLPGKRGKNEDWCAADASRGLLVVADGIGGAPFGDVFSRISCHVALEAMRSGDSPSDAVIKADAEVVRAIRSMGLSLEDGCGSTLVAARVSGCFLEGAFVGDSTAFAVSQDGILVQLAAPDRADDGNAIRSWVGRSLANPPMTFATRLQAGSRVALCTDGVWEPLRESSIASILSQGENAPLIAHALVRAAVGAGEDNACAAVLLVSGFE